MENYFDKIVESINALNSREDMDAFYKNFQKVYDAWGVRQKKINTLQAQLFNVGDRVTFNDRKGITQEGTVTKVKVKNIMVLTDSDVGWDIPASFLTKLKEVA